MASSAAALGAQPALVGSTGASLNILQFDAALGAVMNAGSYTTMRGCCAVTMGRFCAVSMRGRCARTMLSRGTVW